MDPALFDFEICVPVAAPIAASGRVQPGRWPAMRVVRTNYRGDIAGLGEAWGAFEAWIAENGHAVGGDLWERYVAGPESSQDASSWCTELSRQLLE